MRVLTTTAPKPLEQLQRHRAIFLESGWSFAHYYLTCAQNHANDFEILEAEWPNFTTLQAWLLDQNNHQSARLLVALLECLLLFYSVLSLPSN